MQNPNPDSPHNPPHSTCQKVQHTCSGKGSAAWRIFRAIWTQTIPTYGRNEKPQKKRITKRQEFSGQTTPRDFVRIHQGSNTTHCPTQQIARDFAHPSRLSQLTPVSVQPMQKTIHSTNLSACPIPACQPNTICYKLSYFHIEPNIELKQS